MKSGRVRMELILSIASLTFGVAGAITAMVFYSRLRVSHSTNQHFAAMGVLAILIPGLFVVGALGLAGYLLATIRTRERKTKTMLVSGHVFNLLQEKRPDLSGNIVVAAFVFIR